MTTTGYRNVFIEAGHWGPIQREALADEAFIPGHLLRFDADEELEKHGTADGFVPGRFFAVESPTPDTATYPTTPSVDIPYVADRRAYYAQAKSGDVIYAFIAASEVVVFGVTPLVSNGDGTLKAATVDATTLEGAVVGVAWQDLTAGIEATRCKVLII